MFKTSVATRVISFAVLITVLLASFPTAVAAAKDNNRGLEAKWAKLIDIYNRQSITHNSAPRWVAQWMSDHRRAPARKKAELQKDLARSNAAWAPVPSRQRPRQSREPQAAAGARADCRRLSIST